MTASEIMDREERLNRILTERGAGFTVRYYAKPEDDGIKDAFMLQSVAGGPHCTPLVYLQDTVGFDDSTLADYMETYYRDNAVDIDVMPFVQREYILAHVLPRLRQGGCKDTLETAGIAFISYLDLLISFYLPLDIIADADGGQFASLQISNNILQYADITIRELYDASVKNISVCTEISSMGQVIQTHGATIDAETMEAAENAGFIIATTKNNLFGAAVILNPEFLEHMAEMLGESFLVLPSSVNEVLILPDAEQEIRDYFSACVAEVNERCVIPKERLANHAYLYQDGEIKMI